MMTACTRQKSEPQKNGGIEMAKKYELISDLYEQISIEVTRDPQTWRLFLKTACRNYKLRFDEQLLLFAQRPDAIAVLEIERWNTAFGRWVNRGAKGIAVFEDSTGESQRLKYYFDIADTHGTEQSREVPVWKMSEEYQSDVAEALKNAFGTSTDSDDLRIVIKESVVNAVDDNIDDYIYGIVKSGTGSEIDYMKPEDAEEIYKRIVTNSVVYMIYERLGMDNLLTDDDFNGIEYFSTPELLNSIGYATGDIARMGLGIVSKTIRSTKKEKQQVIQPVINKISDNERSSYNERNHLHNAGRLSDSGSDITDTTGSYSRQMGRDEERISEAASQSNVLQSDDKRSVDAVSRRRGTESTQTGGRADERNVGKTGTDRRAESERYDEMGSADEQSQTRSSRDSYSADNNERLSNIKPLPSINEQTAFIAEYEAEVTKASAFSIPNEIINDHLANGSGFRDGKYRIYEQLRRSLSQKENADFLKNEYGIGGGTHAGGVSGYYYDHNAKGICISKGFADNATRINLNWLEVAKRIQLLINNDRYLNAKEKEHYAQWLNEREERQYTEQGLSTSENKDNEKYIYKVGDTVFIGASEYRITAKDDKQIMLSDANAPLFNKQYDIADFEQKIKENALNEHLKVILSEEESNTSVISETNTTPINDDDYYFNDAERKEVVAVYYNPDAISGGQFVFAHIPYDLISKAKDVASDTDSFYEYLDENAYTELIDVGTEEYRTVLSEYSDPNPDFIGRNEENMLQLIALAKNEKITYDKNGYHADDLDEGDLIKVDGEIWAVKSVSSYSISLINESGDKKYISNSPDSKWQETLVSRYNFEFIGNREGTNTQVNNESTDSKQLKTAHEHKKNRKQNNAPSVLYPEINNDYRTNFHIDTDELGAGTPLERYYNNINAIRLLKKLNSEHRLATPTEQVILSQYVGWGGLPQFFEQSNSHYNELKDLLTDSEYTSARESTLTAFYTPPTVISAVYKVLENMNFKNGNLLEPSCGIGNFIGMLPKTMQNSKVYGVELDTISAGIAQQLYQKSSIAAQGFENVNIPDSFFDGVVGNVPFGDFKVVDKKYDKHNFLIHDYFFAKSLDKLRPGGVMALITSKGTMDKENSSVRKYIAQRAELLGAIRLPNDTFKSSAGTEVVSDILFLQKRDRLIDIEPDWVHLDTNENGIRMNSYFVQNPEMVLGEMKTVSGRFGQQVTCEPYTDSNLANLLSDAIANIHGEISDYENDVATDELEEDMSIPADASVKNFSYSVVNDKLYFRENSRMIPVIVSATAESRIKGLIIIRDCTRNLIELQADDYPEEDIKAAQELLNTKYDNFTDKYGLINSRANKSAFSDDTSFALVSALEILSDEGQLERKADIFFKRTIMPHKPITQVDTASEALAVSIGEKACIDIEYMQSLTGKEENELFNDLKGVIFLNPLYEGNNENLSKYFTADEYLSGNVREKLAIARNSAKVDSRFNINVEALEKVQPEDLTASEISVRLGSTWLPVDIVQQFIYEFLNTPGYAKSSIIVHYSKYTGEWSIDGKSYDRSNVKAYNTYGSARINAYRIIEETLNLKDVRIFDYVEDIDGNRKAVLNKKETAIAQSKQELIKQGFQEWVWSDPQRRERLCKLYNERFNSIRPREYDGSHIVFSGMNPEITLREHQRNAVAHILYGGNTLLAHAVGAGKTFEMVAAAMESKRLGLCNKSLFVVPNHLTEQWAAEFLQLYPSANILVATKKDFETKNRKRFCGRIATGDYDAVIIGHSQFEKIPMSIERQRASLEQQENEITNGIAELKRNRGENFSIKQLEKAKKAIRQKIEKLNDQSRKDDVVTFEELGVDRLFIDESHYYKNLYLYTKMRNVGGIAQTEAQKSSDLFMKCRYLDELTGGRGTVFATGTPISNSMVELYTIQRYLQYDTLAKNELQHFDAWASTFGETVTAIELTPEGTGYRAKTRFAKFFNLPELMSMFKEVADIRTADMLELPVPKANFHNVAVKPSEIQKDMVAKLAERAELVRKGNVDASVDNMLKITNDGRKLALDQRMLNEMLPDFEGSKINACIDNIYRIWEETADKKSAQLVFCDLSTPKNDGTFSVYNDIRKKLIERGIPESEVRFIHEADTDVKKKELFQKTRKGEVRVLLGSTQKMGAGTNVQDRLIALHDIDCPWRPSDLEQRAGRIIRQGNSNPEVEIYRYVTEQTFDAYLYQLVEGKQKFASQIMTSKSPVRSADDIDETALSYAEIKMLATGNPYIKEKMDLDIQVQKLKLLKANYLSEKYNLEDKIIKFYPQKIAALNNTIKALEQDLATAKAHPKPSDDSFVGIEIDGKYISEKADAGKAILEFCKQMNNPDPIAIGKYRGFDMELQFSSGVVHCYEIALKGATTQKVSLGEDANGNITRIDNAIGRLSEHIENTKVELKNIQTQYETAQIEVQKPFAQEEELKAKTKRQIEVEKLISSGATDEQKQEDIPDCYYFPATDEQINALTNASVSFEKQTKSDGSIIIRVGIDDKEKAETIMNAKKVVL
jgi:N12 class adenine-specific DNA methylase